MVQLFKSFEENVQGRDFVCADVHGYFDKLELELEKVAFDTDRDRLFSLGDLIDRGQDSYSTLKWLKFPWFHAVIGNHESMFMEQMIAREKNKEVFNRWMASAQGWRKGLSVDQLLELHYAICELPVVMEVALSDQRKIGLCHAQFPGNCDWNELKARLVEEDYEYLGEVFDDLVWSSSIMIHARMGEGAANPVKNIDHVFHGHNIVEQFITLANRTYMDLGSYFSGKVGFVQPDSFLKEISARSE
ncbi:Serine/threonine-protein phosphatase 2 [Thalassocella blandensis]|nr:Serine/threonine-protein phosphatase 2 [Thalassocella blandensis]